MHPVVGQALGQPDPPLDTECLADIEGEQRAQHMDGGEHREDAEQVPERRLVKALQGAVEAVVPKRKQHVQANRKQRQDQQQGKHQQRPPTAPETEIGPGKLPELAAPARTTYGQCGSCREADKGDERGDCQPAQALLQGLVPVHFHDGYPC
ncbi:hypothetical protein D3C81_1419950 [compost metagenome]